MLIRAPGTPADALIPLLLTVIRTPGMTLKLLRATNPMTSPSELAEPLQRQAFGRRKFIPGRGLADGEMKGREGEHHAIRSTHTRARLR